MVSEGDRLERGRVVARLSAEGIMLTKEQDSQDERQGSDIGRRGVKLQYFWKLLTEISQIAGIILTDIIPAPGEASVHRKAHATS